MPNEYNRMDFNSFKEYYKEDLVFEWLKNKNKTLDEVVQFCYDTYLEAYRELRK